MSSTENDPTTVTQAPALDANELRDVLGDEVDARLEAKGFTEDRIAKLDRLDILDSIESTFEGLFEKHKQPGNQIDKAGLLSDLDKLIDSKLANLGTGGDSSAGTVTARKSGFLGRWLTGSSS